MIVPKPPCLTSWLRIVPRRSARGAGGRRAAFRLALALAACWATAAPAPAGAAGEDPALRIIRATDTLGRDISGHGQALRPLSAGAQPLLVQVLDERGAPIAGADIVLLVEPGYDERGVSYHNGGLHPLEPVASGLPRYQKRAPACPLSATSTSLTVRSDVQGYAGAYFYPGRRIGTVQIKALPAAGEGEGTVFLARVIDPRWALLLWTGLLGGLALFLVGMRMTSTGLEQVAGHRLRHILGRVGDSRPLGLLTGMAVTVLLQSSSATTVMIVSFTNAGLMQLGQTLAIILGADIGTTLTVQLIAFPLKEYSLLVVFAGFVLSALPARRYRSSGQFLLGFGLIFYGMSLMSQAVDPLRDHPFFRQLLLGSAERPLLVLLAATLFTGLIQSSAATIGLALTLSFQGLIDLTTAIPVILGANIGTCVTACLAALGTRREAVRVAYAHIFFKVAAVAICLPLSAPFAELVRRTTPDLPRQIANAHTLFNVAAALLFLPLLPVAERLLRRLLPQRLEERERTWSPKYIETRMLEVPALALAQVSREILRMGETTLAMLRDGMAVIRDRDEARMRAVVALDDKVDALDDALRHYLTRLSRRELGEQQAARTASYLYLVHHFETIGDLVSKNLMTLAGKMMRDDLRFSREGMAQWTAYYEDVITMLEKALLALATNDQTLAREVVQTKAPMVRRARALHFEHLDRLGQGIPETEATSPIHIHLISDLRRIASYTASIAAAVVNEYRIPDQPDEGAAG